MSLKLYFFGDSICVGQYVSIHKTWVSMVSKKLEEDLGDKVIVMNASVNGNTTRIALERMHYDVLSHNPDIVFIQFGMNDCNIWETDKGCQRVALESYIQNLKEMFYRAKANDVKKVLFNTNHPSFLNKPFKYKKNTTYETSNSLYYKALKKIQMNSQDVLFLDVREHIESKKYSPEAYLLEDGIHLNIKGHEIYCDYIYPFIKKTVNEVSSNNK